MRIVGGALRGREVVSKHFRGRPTSSFAREGLFNVLANRLEWPGVSVLDLYAGTGMVAFECMSRGARSATCVELAAAHVREIRRNSQLLGIANLIVCQQPALRYIQRAKERFQLIFADPPYDIPGAEDFPAQLLASGLLEPGGLFVYEHRKGYSVQPAPSESRSYGDTTFAMYGKGLGD